MENFIFCAVELISIRDDYHCNGNLYLATLANNNFAKVTYTETG